MTSTERHQEAASGVRRLVSWPSHSGHRRHRKSACRSVGARGSNSPDDSKIFAAVTVVTYPVFWIEPWLSDGNGSEISPFVFVRVPRTAPSARRSAHHKSPRA